jgi:hypothetical protein
LDKSLRELFLEIEKEETFEMANEIMENSEKVPEKTRVAKSAHFVLLFVLTDRYSTAAIGCEFEALGLQGLVDQK